MSDCLEVVESLSQKEKNKILSVLKKDEQIRHGQERKISQLKKEIQEIRMKAVLRAGDDQNKLCRRCRVEFGFLFNRGTLCSVCRFKVCKNCQEFMFNGSWLCIFCYKTRQLKWMTGEWATFDQNPLRKWASGSDILRASFQLYPGPSIDVDEPQQHGRTQKNARNGVAGGETTRARVDAPRDGDQHKLSQLFDVLRSKKPDPAVQQTQVRRVTSGRYHESDSESSSSSDVENEDKSGHSSPNALSVTESEKDALVGIESPRLSERSGEPTASDSGRTNQSNERVRERQQPAPRSPQPAPRKKHSDTLEPDIRVVRPKERPERKSEVIMSNTSDRLFVEDATRVSLSKSVDTNLSDTHRTDIDRNRRAVSSAEINLQKHVNKTRESLERKQEASKADTRSPTLSDRGMESQLKKGKDKRHRKSADDLLENNVRKTDEKLRKSDNHLDGEIIEEPIIASRKTIDNESAILMTDYENIFDNNANKTDMNVGGPDSPQVDKQQYNIYMQNQEEDIQIQVPRGGSPYSVSMDSIPSSHPSPTFKRSSIGGSSHAESSDTDSLSRQELGEFSGTESAQHGHDEDFVVEEISKIRFQRVSKAVGKMGIASKLAKSPRKKLGGLQETPMMITECSTSQDDSGHVSGGSRGATPEHRRTDSGYSQSSLPSTLSTVTDRSEEEEDIDKVIANIHTKPGGRGNLLSVFSDSRESIASYYSDAGDIAYSTVPVTGEILFSINYNYKTVMLEIGVKQCRNIAVADTKKNRSDPYVKTYLLPDRTRSGKRKTKIKKHTVNPTFDDTLKYSISKSELENRTLWVTMWHSDRFGRNIFLGEVTINFDYYKFDDPSPRWYELQERMDSQPSSMMVYKGDLSLCIRYVPANKVKSTQGKGKQKKEKEASKGQLEVMVKEARNLTAVRSNGFSDPFCKGYLLPERHKSSKQKTAVIKKECNPTWNHTFIFEDVSLVELRERCLELTIWDYEKLSSNDFLGGVRLNLGTGVSQGKQVDWLDARGEEMSMWQAMLDRPNLWIDGALILRPNMEKRKF